MPKAAQVGVDRWGKDDFGQKLHMFHVFQAMELLMEERGKGEGRKEVSEF